MSFEYKLPIYKQNEILYVKYSMNCNNGSLSSETVIVITEVEQSDLGILYKFRELGTDKIGTFTDVHRYDKFGNNRLIKTDITLSEQVNENRLYAYVRLNMRADELNDSNAWNLFILKVSVGIITVLIFNAYKEYNKLSVSIFPFVMFIPIIFLIIISVYSIISYAIGKVKYKKVVQQLELLEEDK